MRDLRSQRLLQFTIAAVSIILILLLERFFIKHPVSPATLAGGTGKSFIWQAPDTADIPRTPDGELIRYGRALIIETSRYLGPRGKIAAISNGMNCENCHLDAGTRYRGNNYSAVFSTYPRFRERSGTVENIYKRINDCIERSLNGQRLDSNSREMKAISAYINWLGKNVPHSVKPGGAGITDIPYLDRACDPQRGQIVYVQKCQRCHGADGSGLPNADTTGYAYPPLWGAHSYNTGAGLYRISRFAGFVKENMPFNAAKQEEKLTDEEAWDVAAFVNSQSRPQKPFPKDWPNISGKPIDHPFGPYADSFSEKQHKYGPFGPIEMQKKNRSVNKSPR